MNNFSRRRLLKNTAGLLVPVALTAPFSLTFPGILTVSRGQVNVEVAGGGEGFAHGDEIVLTGTGYGSKSLSNLLYDDFTLGTLGQSTLTQAARIGTWADEGDEFPENPEYALTTRGVHNRCSSHRFEFVGPVEARSFNVSHNVNPPAGTTRCYFDFWIRQLSDDGVRSRNQKNFRCFPVASDSNPDWDAFFYSTTLCDSDSGYFAGCGSRFVGYDNGEPFAGGRWPINNTWFHMQAGVVLGANNTADGRWFIYQDNLPFVEENNITIRSGSHVNREIRQIRLIHYCGTDGNVDCDQIVGYDVECSCAYIDYGADSWKRVEIGNNAVYANCTIREIQPLSAWANTSISIPFFNRGQLNIGAAWVHILGTNNESLDVQEIEVV